MKIVLVHNTYQQPGGEDAAFRNEYNLLTKAGHEVVPYVRSNHDASHYISIRQLALAKRTIWASDTRKEFRQLLRQEKPQIVHVHNTFLMVSPSIYWACRDAEVPVIQTLHNYRLICPGATLFRDGKICEECVEHGVWQSVRYGCYRKSRPATAVVATMLTTHRFFGTWSRMIDYYLVLTEFARRKFIAGGIPPDKIVVKPNFVDPDPGNGHGERSYALFVGRLSPEKGLETLLAAWSRLGISIPLHIIGDGPIQEQLEEYVRQSHIPSVRFLGSLKWEQVVAAMQGALFLLFPSQCFEGLPMTVIEAFACGTPVIASGTDSRQELISDGCTGLHFTPGDALDLANKAEWAWTHPRDMAEMGKQARLEYEAKYTSSRNYKMLLQIYDRAIQHHEGRFGGFQASLTKSASSFGARQEESF
jgi:glycosyltransferase involved in cell wall biosynthesis